MRSTRQILGMLLLTAAGAAASQDRLCNPCIDRPETIQRTTTIERNVVSPSASQVASRIRELGGELRDITHDCGIPTTRSYGQISFSVSACNWGGRFPALLLEPAGLDDSVTLVVLAAKGSTVEVLFEEAASASMVRIFSGLLKEDFDRMYRDVIAQGDG